MPPRRKPSKRFTCAYGRAGDPAGIIIACMILLSAVVAGCESVQRIFQPHEVRCGGAMAAASLVDFIGNEGAPPGIPPRGTRAGAIIGVEP